MEWVNVSIPEGFAGSKDWFVTSDGAALNVASIAVTAVIKPSEEYEDGDVLAYQLEEGDGVTIVDAAAGRVKLALPAAISQAPSAWFYRIDVGLGSDRDTAIAGWITVQDV